MADIFISYKRGDDAPRVEAVVGGLRAHGFSVWWDHDIPAGAPWEETIRAELDAAKLVIVCWSKDAVDSENVRSEARVAKERGKLLQIFVSPCEPPLFFGEHQGLQIFDVNDVYGPKFERLIGIARDMLGAASPTKPARNDKSVRAWRRNEPAAPWEASQFGFTLALATIAVWALLYGVMLALRYFGVLGEGSLAFLAEDSLSFGALAAAPMALVGGWFAYFVLARRPRATGFLRATALGLLTGALPLALLVVVVVAFLGGWPGEASDDGSARDLLLLGAVSAAVARLWFPAFVGGARRLLRGRLMRMPVAALALALPLAGWGVTINNVNTNETDWVLYWLARERGFATLEDSENHGLTRETIEAMQGRFDMPVTGRSSRALLARLLREPAKTEWVLAADGSGDATTPSEILNRAGGAELTILVRPGTYQWDNSARALLMGGAGTLEYPVLDEAGQVTEDQAAVRLSIVGVDAEGADYRRDHIVIESPGGMRLANSVTISHLTIRATPGPDGQVNAILTIRGDAVVESVTLRGPDSVTGVWVQDFDSDERRAQIQDSEIIGPLSTGINVSGNAAVDVFNTFIGESAQWCVFIYDSPRAMVIRNNDFRSCATARGAVVAPIESEAMVADNLGAASEGRAVATVGGAYLMVY